MMSPISFAPMKPAPFKYIAAQSLDHALALKSEFGEDAHVLAGGQSLVPTMNFRLAQPAVLVDINPLTELAGITRVNGHALRIGAMTRYRALERDAAVGVCLPLVREAMPHIAHPQIRNRGTLGGNLAHADPASELPAIALALGGRLRAQSKAGERWIEARDFFLGPLSTALAADELLVEVELPAQAAGGGSRFMEVARRRGDFALAGVAIALTVDDDKRCAGARIALCGAGDTPVDASAAAAALTGCMGSDAEIDEVATSVRSIIEPPGNVHASGAYQRHLAGVLVKRALRTALERARHG
jgi:CO/xanthine dehydrogenase FAD-binding subunit